MMVISGRSSSSSSSCRSNSTSSSIVVLVVAVVAVVVVLYYRIYKTFFPLSTLNDPTRVVCVCRDRPRRNNTTAAGMRQASCDTGWRYVHPSYGGSKQKVIHRCNLRIRYKNQCSI